MSQPARSRKRTRASGAARSLQLVLPATSANLGPAFDAAALAMSLFLKVKASPAGQFSVVAEGRDRDICSRLEDHLIFSTYRDVLRSHGREVQPLQLTIENDIPIGKGCGSSAAARLAGIAFAVHFGGLRWSDDQIVGEASRREHHPDNAAACWMGGLAVARMTGDATAQVMQVRPHGRWPLLLAVPPQSLSTEEARRVLPVQYSRSDAVFNLQNSMLLLGALSHGRKDVLAFALEDRIHQPYRARLCPLLPALQAIVGRKGVKGAALSGAGPSVLLFLEGDASLPQARAAAAACLQSAGLMAELIPAAIVEQGAAASPGWRRARGAPRKAGSLKKGGRY